MVFSSGKGDSQMTQEDESISQARTQHGELLRRAYKLLETLGKPSGEEILIRHLLGARHSNGNRDLTPWHQLLHQILQGSTLFEEIAPATKECEALWALASWRVTKQPLAEIEFVVIDTEMTGLRPGPDRVIEVAAVRIRDGKIIDSFQSLVNPERHLPPFIVKFTGISSAMLLNAPAAHQMMPEFLRYLGGSVLVGHNLGFDLKFLTHEAQVLGLPFPLDGLDTIPLARRFLPGLKRFKLDIVADYLHIPPRTHHRALGDAETTAAVFLHLLEQAQTEGIITLLTFGLN
jgi:DNA polymerase III subunit epsilon